MLVFMAQNVGMINKNGVSKKKQHTSGGTYFSLWLVVENIDNRKQFSRGSFTAIELFSFASNVLHF